MEEKEYSVSEAVRLIGVESHVLRYWEEELALEIRRSGQGHRVYSEENIETLRRVRELKEKGLQLKAIRLLLDGQGRLEFGTSARDAGFARQIRGLAGESEPAGQSREQGRKDEPDDTDGADGRTGGATEKSDGVEDGWQGAADGSEQSAGEPEALRGEIIPAGELEPLRQFERILRRMMEEVVSEQNVRLEESIAARVKDELEEFYLQYGQIAREAAATLEEEKRAGALRRVMRRLFRRET